MKSFEELNLDPALIEILAQNGITAPTPIQAQAWPQLYGKRTDFMGLAATGTGKTLAFGVPLVESIDPKIRGIQTLVLCPTRELALQVGGQLEMIGKYKRIRSVAIYGGAPYGDQLRGLKNNPALVVGTPGRIIDHIKRGSLDLSQVTTIVLDEADEMISMGFTEDLEAILAEVNMDQAQLWFFCATMDRQMRKISEKYLRDPGSVEVNRTEVVPDAIDQIYYRTYEEAKPQIVSNLIEAAGEFYGIIFCQTKVLVADLTQFLRDHNLPADCLHGDMDQNARERTMKAFRDKKITILVCTDVASRGLDVKDITHVINYSLPREMESYVHRIGRTARSGKKGIAINLVTPSHKGLISRIEQVTKSKMREGQLPSPKEIGALKVGALFSKFQDQKRYTTVVPMLNSEWKIALAEMSSEEVAARLLSMMLPEALTAPKTAQPEFKTRSFEGGRGGGPNRGGRSGGGRGGAYEQSRGGGSSYRGEHGRGRNEGRGGERGRPNSRFNSNSAGEDTGGLPRPNRERREEGQGRGETGGKHYVRSSHGSPSSAATPRPMPLKSSGGGRKISGIGPTAGSTKGIADRPFKKKRS